MILELGYSDDVRIDQQTQACRKLWAAVFVDGVRHAAKEYYVSTGDRHNLRWFISEDQHIGSFEWLCSLFDLHPDHARSSAREKFRTLTRQLKWIEEGK